MKPSCELVFGEGPLSYANEQIPVRDRVKATRLIGDKIVSYFYSYLNLDELEHEIVFS